MGLLTLPPLLVPEIRMPGIPIARVLGVAGVGAHVPPRRNSSVLASIIMAYCRIVGVPAMRDELRAIREIDIYTRGHVMRQPGSSYWAFPPCRRDWSTEPVYIPTLDKGSCERFIGCMVGRVVTYISSQRRFAHRRSLGGSWTLIFRST